MTDQTPPQVEDTDPLFEAPPLEEQERMVEAILFASAEPVTVTEMNARMPHGCNAAEAVAMLRADPRFERLPIIALTAHALSSEIARIQACGVDAVLSKPLDEDELFAMIGRLLGRD